MSPRTHNTRSPLSLTLNGISVDAGSSQFPRRTSRDTHHSLAPERGHWPPRDRKFWIHESPSSSSQDGKSNSSSGGKSASAGSERPEERRDRTVSPYGSFFAEEMEFDSPAESRSSRQGDRQEGTFLPTRSSQAQMAPVLLSFTTGYPTQTSTAPAPDHDASRMTTEMMPFSPLSLAENSRRSQPPNSWRQGFLDHPDPTNSQRDPPPQVATAVPRDKRQTRGTAQGRRWA
jgi:hypothetical protein